MQNVFVVNCPYVFYPGLQGGNNIVPITQMKKQSLREGDGLKNVKSASPSLLSLSSSS